ncbi:MAG: molecular chaperone [Gammaproteobacteria bacterium]|nr:MAG: molecular chaperone [Gammaproteobacteria bacterium]
MRNEPLTANQAKSGISAESSQDSERVLSYRLLATLLRQPPGDDMLAYLRSLEVTGTEGGELGVALQMLGLAARSTTPAAVDDEFHELFIGLGRGELVPYASWYLTGYLMEQPLARLREDLARLGFARSEAVKEPEDHVAALLEVMSFLAEGPEPLSVQAAFHDLHLAPWVGRFFEDLAQARAAVFYRSVARLGALFLESERLLLEGSA